MSLTKILLAGTAVCALCTASALAADPPKIHLANIGSALTMKASGPGHFKSNTGGARVSTFTETLTFSGTLSAAADWRVPVLLNGETWYSSATCLGPAHERGVFKQRTAIAQVTNGTSTGTIAGCGATIFTFHGPVYKLYKRAAKSDVVKGAVFANHFVGYNLTLNETIDLTITHP
jgi:hypothetical protein